MVLAAPSRATLLSMADLRRQQSLPVQLSSAKAQRSRSPLSAVRQLSPAGARSPTGARTPEGCRSPEIPRSSLSPMRPLSPAGQSTRLRRRGSEPVRKPSFDDMQNERRRRSRQSQKISSSMYDDDEKIRRAWKRKYMLLGLLAWAATILLGRLLYLRYTASGE